MNSLELRNKIISIIKSCVTLKQIETTERWTERIKIENRFNDLNYSYNTIRNHIRWYKKKLIKEQKLINRKKGIVDGIVYKITNSINDKVYVGQTINGIKKRWYGHKADYKRGNWYTDMYKDFKQFGIDKFKIEVIDTARNQDELDKKERYWINKYKGYNNFSGIYSRNVA